MLYPHSLLWHYLWVGPHVIQLCLAVIIWKRGLYRRSPVFLLYIVYEGLESLTLYGMDISPALVSDLTWWRADYVGWAVEGLLKIGVIWEVFRHLVRHRSSSGRYSSMFFIVAFLLGCTALWVARRAPEPYPQFPIVARVHVLIEGIFIVTCGLWVLTFLSTAYFHLGWDRWDFGIALGAGISASVELGTYSVMANYRWFPKAYLLDFLGMAAYHACVVIWCYYLLRNPGEHAPATGAELASRTGSNPQARQPLQRQFYRHFA